MIIVCKCDGLRLVHGIDGFRLRASWYEPGTATSNKIRSRMSGRMSVALRPGDGPHSGSLETTHWGTTLPKKYHTAWQVLKSLPNRKYGIVI